MSPKKASPRGIKKSQESEAEAMLHKSGGLKYKVIPKKAKGVPEGFRRHTCVLDMADLQLMRDWAATAHGETLTSVMAVALSEYIEKHIKAAAADGYKVRRPNYDSEEVQAALAKYPDLYEDGDGGTPYMKYL